MWQTEAILLFFYRCTESINELADRWLCRPPVGPLKQTAFRKRSHRCRLTCLPLSYEPYAEFDTRLINQERLWSGSQEHRERAYVDSKYLIERVPEGYRF